MCYIQRRTGKVITANIGDSKSMHLQGTHTELPKISQVCRLHELTDPQEQQRIHNAGYRLVRSYDILRVYNPQNPIGGINMSRSLGDFNFKLNLKDP